MNNFFQKLFAELSSENERNFLQDICKKIKKGIECQLVIFLGV